MARGCCYNYEAIAKRLMNLLLLDSVALKRRRRRNFLWRKNCSSEIEFYVNISLKHEYSFHLFSLFVCLVESQKVFSDLHENTKLIFGLLLLRSEDATGSGWLRLVRQAKQLRVVTYCSYLKGCSHTTTNLNK